MARVPAVKKPYERPGPRATDKVWKHDRAPGIPAAIKATNANPAISNTKLVVSNLHYEVTAKDLIAIFGQIGTLVREPHIKYDRSGRSTGVAFISFETPVEATRAKKQFDGILAKGQPMSISYDTALPPRRSSAPASLLNRIQKPSLIDRLAESDGQTTRATKDDSAIGPVRNRRRGGGRAPPRAKKEAKTAEDLDKELDAFMGDDAAKDSFTGNGANVGDVEMAT